MKKALKYLSYLCEKFQNSIVKQAFLISKQLDMENRKSNISELKTYLRETRCYNSDTLGFMRQSPSSERQGQMEAGHRSSQNFNLP